MDGKGGPAGCPGPFQTRRALEIASHPKGRLESRAMKQFPFFLTLLTLAAVSFNGAVGQETRIWTSDTGQYTVEASFVSLIGDQVTLNRTVGGPVTLPLSRLSPADQAVARQLAAATESGPAADAGAPAPPTEGVKVAAGARLQRSVGFANGVETSSHMLRVEVTLTGGAAAEAGAVGPVTAEPVTVDGAPREARQLFALDGFKPIDREAEGIFAEHPKDGIKLELDFGEVPEDTAVIGPVRGSVLVMAGGAERTVEIADLGRLQNGPLADPALERAGITATLRRAVENGEPFVEITIRETQAGSFGDADLLRADGSNPYAGKSSGRGGDEITVQFSGLNPADLSGVKLVLRFREGGAEVSIPFDVPEVRVE